MSKAELMLYIVCAIWKEDDIKRDAGMKFTMRALKSRPSGLHLAFQPIGLSTNDTMDIKACGNSNFLTSNISANIRITAQSGLQL